MLISNKSSTRAEYPTIVNYYGPDGLIWAKELDEFLAKFNFIRRGQVVMTSQEEALAPWISASLSDPESCEEFKRAALDWLTDMPIPRTESKED